MKKILSKRLASILVALTMVLTLLPSTALATEASGFSDVAPGAWYYDAVQYAKEHGMMNGTSTDKFSPDGTVTRGMLVTILYRLDGSPSSTSSCYFPDVASGSYYEDAVVWAADNGIVGGYTNGNFGPNDPVLREQMAAILFRYMQYHGMEAVTLSENLIGFTDADKISPYAVYAMNWAVGAGLIGGFGNGELGPQGKATRAQVASIMMRFCENVLTEQEKKEYSITFSLNYSGAGTYKTVSVKEGEKVSQPSAPSRSGYKFDGWYTSASGSTKYDFSKAVTGDLTLYAKWTRVSSGSSGGGSYVPPYVSSTVSTDIAEKSFSRNVPTEFNVIVDANSDSGVASVITFNFSNTNAVETLEYYDADTTTWVVMSGDFGAPAGFSLSDGTYKFRVTFNTAGEYTFSADVKRVSNGSVLCSTTDAALSVSSQASTLSTNLESLDFVVGVPQEFTYTTVANDDAGIMVIGTSNFSDDSAIEKLEYFEVSNSTWYDLSGSFGGGSGFPMSDATSKFRVTFKKAGDYTFTSSMKRVDNNAVLCSTSVSITVAPTQVTNEAEFTAAANAGRDMILANSFTASAQLSVPYGITIDGNGKTITRSSNAPGTANTSAAGILVTGPATIKNLTVSGPNTTASGWDSGEYGIKVYNTDDVVLEDVTVTGANGGIQVNGSTVSFSGTVTVSGNEFGGIEVCNDGDLDISGATLVHTDTAVPTIWMDNDAQGTVTGADDMYRLVRDSSGAKASEVDYYVSVPENGVAYSGNTYYETLIDAINNTLSGTIYVHGGTYVYSAGPINIQSGRDVTLLPVGYGTDSEENVTVDTRFHVIGTLTIRNMTLTNAHAATDSVSKVSEVNIGLFNEGEVICEGVTFNIAKATAITSWWSTGDRTNVVVRNCIFNCGGNRPIQLDGNATIEDCTFNDQYRYCAQLTATDSVINFTGNTIGQATTSGKPTYGLQLTNDYGNSNLVLNVGNNTIVDAGGDDILYVWEAGTGLSDGFVDIDTITINGGVLTQI